MPVAVFSSDSWELSTLADCCKLTGRLRRVPGCDSALSEVADDEDSDSPHSGVDFLFIATSNDNSIEQMDVTGYVFNKNISKIGQVWQQ